MPYDMTPEHKERLAQGREQARIVKAYLEALEHQPKRHREPEVIREEMLKVIAEQETTTNALDKLKLAAQRQRLSEELVLSSNGGDTMPALEADFIRVAKAYAERQDIPGEAFREIGVPVKVLREAGIPVAAVKRGTKVEAEIEAPTPAKRTRKAAASG